MKTKFYTVLNKLQTIVASIIANCQLNKEINSKLVPATLAPNLFGMSRFPD